MQPRKSVKPIDNLALKYITAQAKLNQMIILNKELQNRIDILIEVKKNKLEFTSKK